MILATRYSGDRMVRSFPDTMSLPPTRLTSRTSSGQLVTYDTASGLPAVGRSIRLVAMVGAALDLKVMSGEGGNRQARDNTPQAQVLSQPVYGMSDYDWRYDVFTALEACENALLLKRKSAGRVVELWPVPIDYAQIRVDTKTGEKRYDVLTVDGVRTYTDDDILHIRGHTPYGGAVGVSRIWQHRDPLGAMMSRDLFQGKFYANGARPGLAVSFPERVTPEQAAAWKEGWDSAHGGDNAGGTAILGGGATLTTYPISLEDAQYVEGKQYDVHETARIMDSDPVLLGADGDRVAALNLFLRVMMPPRLKRVERGLKADPDLFPASAASLYPEFRVQEDRFLDPLTRAQVQHQKIQNGTLLVDEGRADDGRPPLPDGVGMIPQIVPVGGSPHGVADPSQKE